MLYSKQPNLLNILSEEKQTKRIERFDKTKLKFNSRSAPDLVKKNLMIKQEFQALDQGSDTMWDNSRE